MSPLSRAPVSVEEFWQLAHGLPKAELVAGQVVELVLPGARHGMLVALIADVLRAHVVPRGLGIVVAEAGFILSEHPPTVRGPDLAVVLRPRVPSPIPKRFFPGPPDLAVEVLSPDDRPGEVAARIADYLRAGTVAVWIVDPDRETVTVHTREGAMVFGRTETLGDTPPLPGFELPLPTLFEPSD
jgi:Uma2 family endonuclease